MTPGLWLRLHGPDLITMALMGALGLGIYEADPAPRRSFPVFNTDGGIAYPEFAYPLRHEIIPIWASALVSALVPIFFFTLFQIRRRSLVDLCDTTMGLLKSLITAAVFQVFLKWLIGGLRPHFYDVCKPKVPTGGGSGQQTGNGFQGIMYDISVCTGDRNQINDSLESFPSGHSTAAFAGFVFLALYFNAQLKVMSAHNPQYWKMIMFFAPLLGATLIAGALTIDKFHNWYDVLAGAIIGTFTAFVAFRQTFASVFDFRFNHILLPRTSSLFHHGFPFSRKGRSKAAAFSGNNLNGPLQGFDFFSYHPGLGGFHPSMLPFAREGGWGRGASEATLGAPGDATVLYASGGSGLFGAGQGGFGMGGMSGGGMLNRDHHDGPSMMPIMDKRENGPGLPPPVTAGRV
jgi:membrane-associated phospholipid phosphatase